MLTKDLGLCWVKKPWKTQKNIFHGFYKASYDFTVVLFSFSADAFITNSD